jgi:hypothetical protein
LVCLCLGVIEKRLGAYAGLTAISWQPLTAPLRACSLLLSLFTQRCAEMDATGLAIGAVTLISLLKTIVQVSDSIDASKHYGNDSEILSIKLGIERVRLTMWSEKLGLTDVNLDTLDYFQAQLDNRLSDRRLSLAVSEASMFETTL